MNGGPTHGGSLGGWCVAPPRKGGGCWVGCWRGTLGRPSATSQKTARVGLGVEAGIVEAGEGRVRPGKRCRRTRSKKGFMVRSPRQGGVDGFPRNLLRSCAEEIWQMGWSLLVERCHSRCFVLAVCFPDDCLSPPDPVLPAELRCPAQDCKNGRGLVTNFATTAGL